MAVDTNRKNTEFHWVPSNKHTLDCDFNLDCIFNVLFVWRSNLRLSYRIQSVNNAAHGSNRCF